MKIIQNVSTIAIQTSGDVSYNAQYSSGTLSGANISIIAKNS